MKILKSRSLWKNWRHFHYCPVCSRSPKSRMLYHQKPLNAGLGILTELREPWKKSFGFRFVTKTKLLSTFQSLHLENLWSSAASFLMSYHKYLHLDLWSDSLKLGKTRIHALKVKYLVSFIRCTRAISSNFRNTFSWAFLKFSLKSFRSTCFSRFDIIEISKI